MKNTRRKLERERTGRKHRRGSVRSLYRKLSLLYNLLSDFCCSRLRAGEGTRFHSTEHKMFELTVVRVRVVHFILRRKFQQAFPYSCGRVVSLCDTESELGRGRCLLKQLG